MSTQYLNSNLKVFSLNSNKELAEQIAKHIGVGLENVLLIVLVMEKFKLTLKKVSVVAMYSLFNLQASQ